MKCLQTVIIFLTITHSISSYAEGEIQIDSTLANQLFLEGDSLWQYGSYEESNHSFSNAMRIYKATKQWEEYFSCLNRISKNHWILYEFSLSIENALKVLEESATYLGDNNLQMADAYNNIGVALTESYQFETAIENYRKALQIRKKILGAEDLKVADVLSNLGILNDYMGFNDKALDLQKQALDIVKVTSGKNSLDAADFYYNLAQIYNGIGNANLALEYGLNALSIWKDKYGDVHPDLALAYYSIALSYGRMNLPQLALDYDQKVLFQDKSAFGPNDTRVGNDYLNITESLIRMELYDQALDSLTKGMRIVKNERSMQVLAYANSLSAAILFFKKEYNSAIKHAKEAFSLDREHYPERMVDAVRYLNLIAGILTETEDYGEALDFFNTSLEMNLRQEERIGSAETVSFFQVLNPVYLLASYAGIAKVHEKIGYENQSAESFQSALNYLQKCDTLYDEARQLAMSHDDKLELGKKSSAVYESAMRISLHLHEITGAVEYQPLAFYFSEKAKSSVLKQTLAGVQAKSFGMIPDSVLLEERETKIAIQFYQSQILEQETLNSEDTKSKELIASWNTKLFTLRRQLDSLNHLIENQYPAYFLLKYNNETMDVDQVQSQIQLDEAMLSFSLGDSTSYVFVVTKDSFFIKEVPVLEDSMIHVFRDHLKSGRPNLFRKEAYQLYKSYIKESLGLLDSSIDKLIIIPDDQLWYIPFDILVTQSPHDTAQGFENLDYLIENYQIRYANSATLHFNDFTPVETNQELIAFAPSYRKLTVSDSIYIRSLGHFRDQVSPLAFNQSEVENISDHVSGKSLLGNAATEEAFKKNFRNYGILHFAMHTLIDDENPMNSKLVFAHDSVSGEDGFLHAFEIYDQIIPAQMVVLSACETGYGKLSKGEGVMSLARAFSYAGCQSIIMSQWKVNDKSTSDLMSLFYENLSKGLSKDQALRRAKLDFLKTADNHTSNPYHWGGMVLLGDPGALNVKRNGLNMIPIILISAIIIILCFVSFFKYRKSHIR